MLERNYIGPVLYSPLKREFLRSPDNSVHRGARREVLGRFDGFTTLVSVELALLAHRCRRTFASQRLCPYREHLPIPNRLIAS
jgi:hypothetical protein